MPGLAKLQTVENVGGLALTEILPDAIDLGFEVDAETRVAFISWALRIPEPKTGTLDFDRFPFQRELYTVLEEAKDGVVMKGTQVGISAWLIRWAMYWADTRGLTSMYVFPKDKQMIDFSHQRAKPLIKTEYLSRRVPAEHINNVYLRQIGLGWLVLRGSQTKEALDSVDADVVAFDEYDTLVQENIPDAERRVSGPLSKGLIRRVGVPTVDDYGISKLYDSSDKRKWFVKCEHCNERQFLHFFKREPGDDWGDAHSAYVETDTENILCGRCHKKITPEAIQTGEWVAERPDAKVPGYHVHRMMVPGVSLEKLIEASVLTSPFERQIFWNKDLGLPHSEAEGRLTKEALAAAQSAGGGYVQGPRDLGYQGASLVTAGIDVASVRNLYVRISQHFENGKKRALFLGEVPGFDELAEMMDVYSVNLAAIDHLPDGRLARSFANRFFGRVYIAHFLPPTSHDVMTWDEEQRTAGIKRTEAIDGALSLVRVQRNLLPLDWPEDYVSQMRGVQRFYEVDDVGRKTVGYKSLGPIDYLMAEVYDLMATELWRALLIKGGLQAQEGALTSVEDRMEYERSAVNDPESQEMNLGPDEPDLGPEPEEWDTD